MLAHTKRSRSPGRRWIKRSDYIFLSFFLCLVVASVLIAHLSSQAPIPSSSSPPTINNVYSASSGGAGGLGVDTGTNPSQASTLSINGTTSQNQPNNVMPGRTPTPKTKPVAISANDWLLGTNGVLDRTDPGVTYFNVNIRLAQSGVITMADLFLALFIVINGIRVAMGGAGFRYGDALESLPRILLAFVAANTSWYFVASLITINNGICDYILNKIAIPNGAITSATTTDSLTTIVLQIASFLDTWAGFLAHSLLPTLFPIEDFGAVISNAATGVAALVLFVFFVFLAIQLIIRIALINLLIIVAPLGFASWALPQGGGQQLMRVWLNAIFATIFVQFLQLTCYTFGMYLISPITSPSWFGNTSPLHVFLGFDPQLIYQIAILWITLRVPSLTQNVATNMMGEGSRNLSATINQALASAQSALSSIAIAMR